MAYAETDDLAPILNLRNPSTEQTAALQDVLDAAAGEIDSEIDLQDDDDPLDADWQLALLKEVNLERAVEHWQQRQSPFGLIGVGAEGLARSSADSWPRHANKLAPLKANWGIA